MSRENRILTAYFEVVDASHDPALLDECYGLRYQVYCLERQFLAETKYPEEKESDSFEKRSSHFLARHRDSGVPAGTARLVKYSDQGFPMLSRCTIDQEHAHLLTPDSMTASGEVSRVAVSKRFRQRAGDTQYGGPPRADAQDAKAVTTEVETNVQTSWPEIVAGLYKGIYHEAKRSGLSTLIVAMERGLHVLLKRMHIDFKPIGPEIDYYGPVKPYILIFDDAERNLAKKSPATLWYLLNGLEMRFWPRCAQNFESVARARFGEAKLSPTRDT